VDKSNQSYYGRTGLHHVRLLPRLSDARVTDEPVHDAKWAPNGEEFAVIYGAMPDPKISVFDQQCKKRMDLAEHDAPRNTLQYDPTGRILCVGGFASLKGDMDFWDLASPQLRKLGHANAFSSAYHAWSPDGRYFVACVLSPRIRIDNGIKYFNCYGDLLHELQIPELFEVRWATWPPSLIAALRSKPISPRRAMKATVAGSNLTSKNSSVQAATSSAKSPSPASSSSSSTVYRHPNWRGGTETSISTPKTSTSPMPTRYDASGNVSRTLVGGVPLLGGNPVGGNPAAVKLSTPKKKQEALFETAASTEVTPVNKKRNLEKKLRQIEVLKQRQVKGDELNAEQLAKVASEAKVRAEIVQLSAQLGDDPAEQLSGEMK